MTHKSLKEWIQIVSEFDSSNFGGSGGNIRPPKPPRSKNNGPWDDNDDDEDPWIGPLSDPFAKSLMSYYKNGMKGEELIDPKTGHNDATWVARVIVDFETSWIEGLKALNIMNGIFPSRVKEMVRWLREQQLEPDRLFGSIVGQARTDPEYIIGYVNHLMDSYEDKLADTAAAYIPALSRTDTGIDIDYRAVYSAIFGLHQDVSKQVVKLFTGYIKSFPGLLDKNKKAEFMKATGAVRAIETIVVNTVRTIPEFKPLLNTPGFLKFVKFYVKVLATMYFKATLKEVGMMSKPLWPITDRT